MVSLAVERYFRDLDRQNTEAFPYRFDHRRAIAALEFFPLCLRHSIGRYAGLPFELEGWQAFGLANIFGWVRLHDDTRRFRSVYWSMGRKNGKSTFAAGIALYLASLDVDPLRGMPEQVPEVILCATKREQVERVMFAEMLRMRMQSPTIRERSEDINKTIFFPHNQGSIRCIGSDKPYSGLNPHAVIKDEVHELREVHRKFYDTMETGGAGRSQPLSLTFTTAGDDKSYIWLEEYRHAQGVLEQQWTDEALFALSYELDEEDDPCDEELWPKANPNLGISVNPDYLREQPKSTTIHVNRFTRFHGNRLVSSTESAFDMHAWDECAGELSDWSKADAVGVGVDLGGRDDLAAWGAVARFIHEVNPPDPEGADDEPVIVYRYEARAWCYIAQDTDRDISVQPFAEWIADGRIKCCKFPITEMKADIVAYADELFFEDLAYDPAGGQQFAEEMEQEGIAPARMPQTYAMFHEPISELSQAMQDGRLTHTGCPVLRWCVTNAIACRDRQERWMLDKKESKDKIDPIVALVMAFKRAMVAPGNATDDFAIIT